MGIQWAKPLSSRGTDWSRYTPISKHFTVLVPTQTYTTVFSITGKGFISAVIEKSPSSTYTQRLQLIIDGELVYFGNANATSNSYGITTPDFIFSLNTSLYTNVKGNYFPLEKPANEYGLATEQNGSVIIPKPLFFNSSVEVKSYTGNGTNKDFFIAGGLYE